MTVTIRQIDQDSHKFQNSKFDTIRNDKALQITHIKKEKTHI